MRLKDFLHIAEAVQPEETGPLAHLAQQYWEAREAGRRGLLQSDIRDAQVEFLLQLFEYDVQSGTYIHHQIDRLFWLANGPAPKTVDTAVDQFDDFWKLFPRKESKATAKKFWSRHIKSRDLGEIVIAALKVHIQHHGWNDPERRFSRDGRDVCPLPGTWLNGKRWEDELPAMPDIRRRTRFPAELPRDALAGVL